MSDIAISVHNVGKRYHVFENQRRRLMHAFWPGDTRGVQEIWALKDINFEIRRGEAVAIIGRNGGGKSTLLEILTGTLTPTTGSVTVNGRVNALLELGSGFNPEYTGRDNVILNGLLLGLSREDILSRFDEIADFAEIGAAIDRPVKTYSSGMMMRLAFAVQVMTDPDILIIDEALSVGDFFFQQKCMSYIRGLCEKGVTLLFVSHDMGAVRDICQRGMLLERGLISFDGENLEAIRRYLVADDHVIAKSDAAPIQMPVEFSSASSATIVGLQNPLWTAPARAGLEKEAYLCAVALTNADGDATTSIVMAQAARFTIHYQAMQAGQYHLHLQLKNRSNQIITAVGSYNLKLAAPQLDVGEQMFFELEMPLSLEAGEYAFLVSIVRPVGASGEIIDDSGWLGPISVKWDYSNLPPFFGLVGLGAQAHFFSDR